MCCQFQVPRRTDHWGIFATGETSTVNVLEIPEGFVKAELLTTPVKAELLTTPEKKPKCALNFSASTLVRRSSRLAQKAATRSDPGTSPAVSPIRYSTEESFDSDMTLTINPGYLLRQKLPDIYPHPRPIFNQQISAFHMPYNIPHEPVPLMLWDQLTIEGHMVRDPPTVHTFSFDEGPLAWYRHADFRKFLPSKEYFMIMDVINTSRVADLVEEVVFGLQHNLQASRTPCFFRSINVMLVRNRMQFPEGHRDVNGITTTCPIAPETMLGYGFSCLK